jgi:hypothetical protein
MREATPTLRAMFKRRADLGYAVALGLGLAAISFGLAAVIDLIS